MKRTQSYSGPGITVTFDPNLCIHSAVRLRALPTVFGTKIGPAGRVALCRCGGTGNAPFCDGTHRTNGFRPRRPAPGGEAS